MKLITMRELVDDEMARLRATKEAFEAGVPSTACIHWDGKRLCGEPEDPRLFLPEPTCAAHEPPRRKPLW